MKTLHVSPAALLCPLLIPLQLWSYIAMDFIMDLPLSKGNTVILTVVNRFFKMYLLLALSKFPTAPELADVLITWAFC